MHYHFEPSIPSCSFVTLLESLEPSVSADDVELATPFHRNQGGYFIADGFPAEQLLHRCFDRLPPMCSMKEDVAHLIVRKADARITGIVPIQALRIVALCLWIS